MTTLETTEQKILSVALEAFFRQGIKKTSLEEIAYRAGVTRITVYRYFADKQQLVDAALMQIPAILEAVQAQLANQPPQAVETILDQISQHLGSMPAGDFPALLEELRRVYPEVWRRVHEARLRAIEGIFQHLFALAEMQGCLRPGLDRRVVLAYFSRAVVQVLEDPALVDKDLSAAEVFKNVEAIFLYGILNGASQ